MLFNYKVRTKDGSEKKGQIDAATRDLAIANLQRRDYIVVSVISDSKKSLLESIPFFDKVPILLLSVRK